MTTVEVDADVPESRQVTITLPPGVPTGRVRLTVTVAAPDPLPLPPSRPDNPALIPEHDAFCRMLPELLDQYLNRYVAVYQGRVVASANSWDAVEQQVRAAHGDVPAYIGVVRRPAPPGVVHSGVFRIIDAGGR